MASPLIDAPFEQTVLIYSVQSSTPTGTDEFGNPTYDTTTGTLKALLAPFKADQLSQVPGADIPNVPVKGELLEPTSFPAGVQVGSELTLNYGGRSWTLKLTSIIVNDLIGVDFGSYFEGVLSGA